MSTRVGTLQPTKKRRSLWPAAVLLSFVMLTVAVIAAMDRGGTAAKTGVQEPANAVVAGTADTPSFVGGTAANTPSEVGAGALAGGSKVALTPHVPRRAGGESGGAQVKLGATTPSEVSGILQAPSQAEIWARKHIRR